MKHLKPIAALLLLMPISMVNAAEEAPKAAEPTHEMASHKGMGGMTEEQKDQHMRARQEQQLLMHDLSNKILAEQDPTKKEELKKQQLELMKAQHAQMMEHRQQKKVQHKQQKQEQEHKK